MTFKHTDFDDSSTMRSLVRVAKEKGWLPEQNLNKTAAKESTIDLNPSDNLLQNILKLCNGLRSTGFDKYADELEVKYLNYKQANTLYNVSGEDGEDLLHSAHPKGSHKLLDVDSKEATVEDLIDKHLQILEVVNKKPLGKTSSTNDILQAVKIVLSEAPMQQLQSAIQSNVDDVNATLSQVAEIVNQELTFSISPYQTEIKELMSVPKIDNLNKAKSWLEKLKTRLNPSGWMHYTTLGMGGLSEDTWREVQGLLEKATKSLNDAITYRGKFKDLQSSEIVAPPAKEEAPDATNDPSAKLIQSYNDTINAIGLYKARIEAKGLNNATALNQWLDSADALAKKYLSEYAGSQYKADPEINASYTNKLASITSKLDTFKNKWLV
jgi:hypothetical protein